MSELRHPNPLLEDTVKIGDQHSTTKTPDKVCPIRLYRQAGFALVIEPIGDGEFGCLPEQGVYELLNILLDTIDDPAADDVVIDLSRLRAISSRLTNMLSAIAGRFNTRGRRVALCSANATHRPFLAAAGLDCFPSMGQAISHLLFAN
jgi:hypothetical protein